MENRKTDLMIAAGIGIGGFIIGFIAGKLTSKKCDCLDCDNFACDRCNFDEDPFSEDCSCDKDCSACTD